MFTLVSLSRYKVDQHGIKIGNKMKRQCRIKTKAWNEIIVIRQRV
jgi:hypothetical protein